MSFSLIDRSTANPEVQALKVALQTLPEDMLQTLRNTAFDVTHMALYLQSTQYGVFTECLLEQWKTADNVVEKILWTISFFDQMIKELHPGERPASTNQLAVFGYEDKVKKQEPYLQKREALLEMIKIALDAFSYRQTQQGGTGDAIATVLKD